jgi:hypothetical protein
MHTRSKLVLASLTAAAILASALASASARNLSITNDRFRVVWTGLEKNFVESGLTVRCQVTLEGSFHSRTLRKTTGALIGSISRGTVHLAQCQGGLPTVAQESLPWHVRYRSFAGALPAITSFDVEVVGAKLILEVSGVRCTTQSTAASPWVFRATVAASGRIESFNPDGAAQIPVRGSFPCEFAGNYTLSGAGRITLLGSTISISVRLI